MPITRQEIIRRFVAEMRALDRRLPKRTKPPADKRRRPGQMPSQYWAGAFIGRRLDVYGIVRWIEGGKGNQSGKPRRIYTQPHTGKLKLDLASVVAQRDAIIGDLIAACVGLVTIHTSSNGPWLAFRTIGARLEVGIVGVADTTASDGGIVPIRASAAVLANLAEQRGRAQHAADLRRLIDALDVAYLKLFRLRMWANASSTSREGEAES